MRFRPKRNHGEMGDYPKWLWFAHNSKIHFIPDCTAVYRRVQGSASRPHDISEQIEFTRSKFEIKEYFISKYGCSRKDLFEIKKHDAIKKIQKGVLLKSYSLYSEGINEKIDIGLKISILDKLYGVVVTNKILHIILKNLYLYFVRVNN